MSVGQLSPSSMAESHLQIEGEFLGFIRNSEAERKSLRMSVADREIQLKLSKELRQVVPEDWRPGDRIQVLAKTKVKGKREQPQLKVYRVDRLSCTLPSLGECPSLCSKSSSKPSSNKILICQKSGCLKRGGKTLYRELSEALSALNLQDRVKIETTGCQKRCKQAPNMTLMPGKHRCQNPSTNSLYFLLKEHYEP